MVRGAVVLPHGTGQTLRVLVFAKGEKEQEAEAAGADFVGADELVQQGPGRLHGLRPRDRDARHDGRGRQARPYPRPARPHAEPEGRHRHLRRRARAVTEAKAGKVEYRVEKAGIVHARIGKVSFTEKALADNAIALIQALVRAEAVDGQGHLPPEHHASLRRWAPAFEIDPVHFSGQDRGGVADGTRTERDRTIGDDQGEFDRMTSAVFLDFKGMTVEEVTQAPRRVPQERRRVPGRQEHARPARRQGPALGEEPRRARSTGMTGVAWSYEDPSAAAKVVKAFRKDNEKLKVKAGLIEGQVLAGEAVETQLATMPGKNELRAKLLATLQAPLQQFVAAAQAPAQNFVYAPRRRRRREGQQVRPDAVVSHQADLAHRPITIYTSPYQNA